MLFSVSVFPIDGDGSLLAPVADAIDEIDRAGLRFEVTAMDTVIEGEWDEVMPVLRRAEARLRQGHKRVIMQLTVDDHPGVTNRLRASPMEVEHVLGRAIPHA